MKSSLKNMVLVLFVITFVSALLVGAVDMITKDAIQETELKAKNEAKFAVLGTTANEAMVLADSVYAAGDFEVVVSTIVDKSDNNVVVGYAVEAPSITKTGYGGRITLMVGFVETNGTTTINGVQVLSQNETPGLGANMTKDGNSLESSALGMDASKLNYAVKKEGGSFDALTGSTISSRAYANAMETAYAGYLRATGQLDESKIKGGTSSGATKFQDSESATTANDTATGATATTDASTNESEPAAQEGEVSNE